MQTIGAGTGARDLAHVARALGTVAAQDPRPSRSLLERTDLRPYYVVTPPYASGSAGVRVLHLLARALIRVGAPAYVVDIGLSSDPDPFLGPTVSVPILTPSVARQHAQAGVTPVVVYPEVVHGNPLGARHVVRYLLNHPGAMGGPARFPRGDQLLAFSQAIADGAGTPHVLCIPPSDPDDFVPTSPEPRDPDLVLAYASKFRRAGGRPVLPPAATEITVSFPPRGQLRAYLARASVLFAWEDTAVIVEALLSGCPVVVAPDSGLTGLILDAEIGRVGITFDDSPAGLAAARRDVDGFRKRYEGLYVQAWEQLAGFVAMTQPLADDHGPGIDVSALRGHSRPRLPIRTHVEQTVHRVRRRVAARGVVP